LYRTDDFVKISVGVVHRLLDKIFQTMRQTLAQKGANPC
jgi:hypothetical protein